VGTSTETPTAAHTTARPQIPELELLRLLLLLLLLLELLLELLPAGAPMAVRTAANAASRFSCAAAGEPSASPPPTSISAT
jgi:hypothetical protein